MSIADELITRGWYQGDYEGPDGSVCLYGAAWKASGVESLYDWEGIVNDPHTDALNEVVRQASNANVAEFNDAPERTFDEVLRIAKQADEILDNQRGTP